MSSGVRAGLSASFPRSRPLDPWSCLGRSLRCLAFALMLASAAGGAQAGDVAAVASTWVAADASLSRPGVAHDAPGSPGNAVRTAASAPSDPATVRDGKKRKPEAGRTGQVLGLSWLPAFCEIKARRPECVGQTSGRTDATELTLAGLWPVRNSFCKVSDALQVQDRRHDWLALPAVPLSADVGARLASAMPGVASGLDRHLWLRSGSCQLLEPEAYFSLQIRLLEAVNRSAVGALFRSRIGQEIRESEVRAAFDTDFAVGAGERVRLQCRKIGDRTLVTGLTVGLSPTMTDASDFAAAILGAAPIASRCSVGLVDAAGQPSAPRPAGAGAAAGKAGSREGTGKTGSETTGTEEDPGDDASDAAIGRP